MTSSSKETNKKLSERMEDFNDDLNVEVHPKTFRVWMEEVVALEEEADTKKKQFAEVYEEILEMDNSNMENGMNLYGRLNLIRAECVTQKGKYRQAALESSKEKNSK